MIKIGIDARLLSEPLTGIGRYTAELIAELQNYPAHFHLYSPRPLTSQNWQQSDHITVRTASFNHRVSRMAWSQTLLPAWAHQDQLDVFWGPTHRLPRFLPKKTAKVVTIHDLVWKHAGDTMRPLSQWVEQRLMPTAISLADYIVADSKSTQSDIIKAYPQASEKVRVIYPAASKLSEPQGFTSLTSLGISQPYVLFVGTLEPRKNLQRLIIAYAKLPKKIRDKADLVIAGGEGWGNINLRQLITNLGLEGRALPLGYVTDAQLASLYSHALCLAMPSLYEGFGLPIIEAGLYGTPALTSNLSSMPEVVGEAGILVNPLDVDAITSGLAKMIEPQTNRHFANKATANAQRFNWQQAAKELWKTFLDAQTARQRS